MNQKYWRDPGSHAEIRVQFKTEPIDKLVVSLDCYFEDGYTWDDITESIRERVKGINETAKFLGSEMTGFYARTWKDGNDAEKWEYYEWFTLEVMLADIFDFFEEDLCEDHWDFLERCAERMDDDCGWGDELTDEEIDEKLKVWGFA